MTVYVKKPNEVEAVQFDGGVSIVFLLQWLNSYQVSKGRALASSDGTTLTIPTDSLPLVANISEWVVLDCGNVSVKTNANFSANYEIKV
jgi:hypothetical protein